MVNDFEKTNKLLAPYRLELRRDNHINDQMITIHYHLEFEDNEGTTRTTWLPMGYFMLHNVMRGLEDHNWNLRNSMDRPYEGWNLATLARQKRVLPVIPKKVLGKIQSNLILDKLSRTG